MPRRVPIEELDLRKAGHASSTLADRMNTVPGFRTSAAFFTFLRANLVLPQSALNSTTSTPLLDPSSSQTLPPLFPSSLATMTSNAEEDVVLTTTNPLDEIPPLVTAPLAAEADKIAALRLIADSIAQQRQLASRAILFHPFTIAVYVGILASGSQFLYKSTADLGLLFTTFAGFTMAFLVAVRGVTRGYVDAAEELNWNWAKNEEGEEDVIIGSKYGENVIGAAVLRLERSGTPGKKTKKASKHGGKGLVRAWTTKMRYRGTGVGTELLEECVRTTREKLGKEAEIGFAVEHANAKKVLPEFFTGTFRKRELRAAQALDKVVESMEQTKKKR